MNINELLKEKSIKITKARIAIYEILNKANNSISADDIYIKCKELKTTINLSTVYRTLDLFEENKLIQKFDLGRGRYCYKIKNNFHKHTLECNLCHKEIEVSCPIQQIEELLKTETGFNLTEHKLILKGLCKECTKKNK